MATERWRRLIREASWAAAALAVAVVAAVATVGASYRKELQSDDVAQLLALRSWRESGLSRFYVGSDTLLLRAPLSWLLDLLVPPGPRQLRLLTGLLGAFTALLLVAAVRWQARGSRAVALVGGLAAAWVVANPGVAEAIGRPLVRNIELGAAMLGLVALDRLVAQRPRRPLLVLPAVAVGLSALLWDDPYLTYLAAIPAAVLCLLSAAIARSGWRALVSLSLLAGIAGSRALDGLAGLVGIEVLAAPIELLELHQYEDARRAAIDQSPLAFGVSGRPAAGVGVAVAWGNRVALVVLAAAVVVAAVAVLRRFRAVPVGTAVAVLLVPLPLAGWVASSNVLFEYSWRYLVLTPFALAMLVPTALAALPSRLRTVALVVVGATLAVAVAGNLQLAGRRLDCGERCTPVPAAVKVAEDTSLAGALEPAGVTKLFAPYWRANIAVYQTDGAVTAVAVACEDGQVVARRWLITEVTFTKPTATSHLLFEAGKVAGCDRAMVERQLGPPLQIEVVGGAELWSYQGDLAQRLPSVTR